jgi:short-subunit dehydrogenase
MKFRSINIFGITGGIGYSFFNKIKDEKIEINGFYCNNTKLAYDIAKNNPHATLKRIDLSDPNTLQNINLPNCECMLYVVGRPHFGKDFFDFNEKDVFLHINLNISALLIILKKSISNENCVLKRFVIVSSFYPDKIDSLYHTGKSLQDKLLDILRYALADREIGLSIIKTGWVDTNMYKEYKEKTGKTVNRIIPPDAIADMCVKEFGEDKLYSINECGL